MNSVDLILFLQQYPALRPAAEFFSFLGSEACYLMILCLLYWCFSPGTGIRLGIAIMISTGVNSAVKLLFQLPRPFWVDDAVQAWATEASFGLPSGHAQSAVVVWGFLAAIVKQPAAKFGAILLILLISVSRLVLGVHFPGDVLAGWLIGGIILFVLVRENDRLKGWFQKRSIRVQIGTAVLVSLLVLGINLAAAAIVGNWQAPAEWARRYTSVSSQELDPLGLNSAFTVAGSVFGLILGAMWIQQRGGFSAGGAPEQLFVRYLLGIVVALVLWLGSGLIFPSEPAITAYLLRAFRYAVVTFWVTGLAPALFVKLNLAKPLVQSPA